MLTETFVGRSGLGTQEPGRSCHLRALREQPALACGPAVLIPALDVVPNIHRLRLTGPQKGDLSWARRA